MESCTSAGGWRRGSNGSKRSAEEAAAYGAAVFDRRGDHPIHVGIHRRPKGVVLSHGAVAAFVKWTAEEFRIKATGSSGQSLAAGLRPFHIRYIQHGVVRRYLCGVAESIVWMPRFLVEVLRETRVTCWYSVPSILAGMFEDGGLANAGKPDLEWCLFAGEVFAGPKVAWLQHAAGVVWANLYGPTETNVVTWYRVPRCFDSSRASCQSVRPVLTRKSRWIRKPENCWRAANRR